MSSIALLPGPSPRKRKNPDILGRTVLKRRWPVAAPRVQAPRGWARKRGVSAVRRRRAQQICDTELGGRGRRVMWTVGEGRGGDGVHFLLPKLHRMDGDASALSVTGPGHSVPGLSCPAALQRGQAAATCGGC